MSETEPRVFASRARRVAFQEVDAAGTIYFAKVFEYFGDTYLALLEAAGLDVPRMLRERTLAAPLTHAEADYLAPLFFGDEIVCEIIGASPGKTSLSLEHRVRTPQGKVCARGKTVHVFVDGKTFQKTPLPEELVRFVGDTP